MCEIITMGWRLARGVTPNFARCHPQKCPGWIAWHSSRQMNDLSFQKSPDKSQISYFLLCIYIGLFIPVARLESNRLLKHAQSLQLAGDKSHTILPGKMRGITPKNARRHPKKCEASPQHLRGVTPKMEGWPLTSFSKITIFQKQTS